MIEIERLDNSPYRFGCSVDPNNSDEHNRIHDYIEYKADTIMNQIAKSHNILAEALETISKQLDSIKYHY